VGFFACTHEHFENRSIPIDDDGLRNRLYRILFGKGAVGIQCHSGNQLKPFEPEEVAAQAKRERASEEDLHRQRQAKLFLRARAADFQRGQGMAGPVEVTAAEAGLVDEWQVVLTPKPGVTGPPITVVVPARDRSAALLAAAASNPNYLVGAAWLLSRRWR